MINVSYIRFLSFSVVYMVLFYYGTYLHNGGDSSLIVPLDGLRIMVYSAVLSAIQEIMYALDRCNKEES